MKKSMSRYVLAVSLFVAFSSIPLAQADVKLPKVIDSHMVLQRDAKVPVWGTADAGEVFS